MPIEGIIFGGRRPTGEALLHQPGNVGVLATRGQPWNLAFLVTLSEAAKDLQLPKSQDNWQGTESLSGSLT